jgi:hypothetical protein
MKDFYFSIEKMGRSGNEEDGYTLEIDDNLEIGTGLVKRKNVKEVVEYLVDEYPELKLTKDNHEEVNEYQWRIFAGDSCKHYKNADGLSSDSVGMVLINIYNVEIDEDGKILFENNGVFE